MKHKICFIVAILVPFMPVRGEEVGRVYDLKPEILRKAPGVTLNNSLKIVAGSGKQVIFDVGKDLERNASCYLNAREGGLLNGGRLGHITHLVGDIELLSGSPLTIGIQLVDSADVRTWAGLSLEKGRPVRIERALYDVKAFNRESVKQLRILSTHPPASPYKYRINTLQLEFRPETLLKPLLDQLGETISGSGGDRIDQWRIQLVEAAEKVKGDRFLYDDAIGFIRLCDEIKRELNALQRASAIRPVVERTGKGYGVGVADSMTSVFLTEAPFRMKPADRVSLGMAGNEYESFQVVVCATEKDLSGVTVRLDDLTGPDGGKITASTAVVGHSETKPVTYPAVYTGYYPDFIIEYQKSADVKAGETVPFWVRLKTPAGAKPGIYTGTVEVTGKDLVPHRFPVEVRVYGFSLPEGAVLSSIFEFYEEQMFKLYRVRDEAKKQELRRKLVEFAASYKISYDHLYRWPGHHEPEFYEIWKKQNEEGLLKSFTIVNAVFPDKDKNVDNPDAPPVNELLERLRKHLNQWLPVAKEYGFADKAYLYCFDEGRSDRVKVRVVKIIKSEYPSLKIMTTIAFKNTGDPMLPYIDAWVPIAGRFISDPGMVKELRRQGKEVWWYVCNFPRPPHPTFLLEVPAAVPRVLMGAMAAKYRPDGFLFWSLFTWRLGNPAPVAFGPRTAWNPASANEDSGDGNLLVPGRNQQLLPTIRLENYRDGIEDLHYYELLKKAVAEADPQNAKLLEIPAALVKNSREYTTDPEAIRAWRQAMAEAIESLKTSP